MGSRRPLASVACAGLDTSPFIYLIEGVGNRGPAAAELFRELNGVPKVTSTVGLVELLTCRGARDRNQLIPIYRRYLSQAAGLRVLNLDWDLAEKAAELRSAYPLRTPDAVQLAAAISGGADLFITNDRRFKAITEIEVLIFDDWAKEQQG
jgi:predicted nucleic acid-binding protein